jgi:ribosomal protein L23
MANRDPHDVILRPVLTEKGFEGIADKRYIFEVPVDATKTEIKLAVEAVFADDGVKVENVEIGHVDFLKDAAFIKVYYNLPKGEANSVNMVTRAKDYVA